MVHRLRPLLTGLVAISLCYLLYLASPSGQYFLEHHMRPFHDVFNSTLGFHKVYAIGMPDRSDKHDKLSLAASFTGIELNWINGVAPGDISRKAAPPTWDFEHLTPGALGCWRAHMNVMQQIVHDNVQTALILEDDADWDIALKHQLAQFAIGSQTLQRSFSANPSPYGAHWDFLWLGHHRLGISNDRQEIYILQNDYTVPPLGKRRSFWRQNHIPDALMLNNTRLVVRVADGMGTPAVAVTLNGARKVLSAVSLNAPPIPVDMSYNRLCRGRLQPQLTCYGPYPPLFGPHMAPGPRYRDSDINNKSEKWHEEYTGDIVYSVTQNIPRLASGQQTILAQWPQLVENPQVNLPGASPAKVTCGWSSLASRKRSSSRISTMP